MRNHYHPWDLDNPYRRKKPKTLREVPGFLIGITGDFTKRLFYMYGLVWEASPWMLFLMVFMAVFNGVTPVIGATIRAELLNRLASAYLGEAVFRSILTLLITLFAFNITVSLVTSLSNTVRRISNEVVVHHIKLKIMRKAKTVDLASFDMPEFYAKLENANREAGTRPMDILNSSFSLASTLISMVSFIVILHAVSPIAPIIIILFAIPSATVNFIFRARHVEYIRSRSRDRREMNYFGSLVTNQHMVKEVKLYGLAEVFIGHFDAAFRRYFRGQRRLIVRETSWHTVTNLVRTAASCGLFLYIAKKVCDGVLRVGDYSLYTGALSSIGSGVGSFISTTAAIYEGTLFIENMISFMEEEPTVRPLLGEGVKPVRGVGHTIEFRSVSFRYPGTERDVIHNLSVTIGAGEQIVLVGLNGAGKTTLIKLLTRLYDVTEGVILLDGRDIREYDVEALYRLYGIIFQDFGRYAVTVRENIRYGEIGREADEDAIREAAAHGGAAEFVEALPDSYDTPLMRHFEENGVDLSGGQWQKLAIARSFYGEADILILDEPTSALDPLAEQEIYNEFGKLAAGKTTIFVSHRLSSATMATKILVLEKGELIEEGSHAALMDKHGVYHKLFTTQAARYVAET